MDEDERVEKLGDVFKSKDLAKVVLSYDPLPISGRVFRRMDRAAETLVLKDGRVIQVRSLRDYKALVHMLGEEGQGWATKLPLNLWVLYFNVVLVATETVLLVVAGNISVFVLDVETGEVLSTDHVLVAEGQGLKVHAGLSVPRYVRWGRDALEVVDAPTGKCLARWTDCVSSPVKKIERLVPCSSRDPYQGLVFTEGEHVLVVHADTTPPSLCDYVLCVWALAGMWRVGPGVDVMAQKCGDGFRFLINGESVAFFETDITRGTFSAQVDDSLGLFAFAKDDQLLVLDSWNRREIARFPFRLLLSSAAFVGTTLYALSLDGTGTGRTMDEVVGIDWMTGQETLKFQGCAGTWGTVLDIERGPQNVLVLKCSSQVYFLA